MKNSVDPSSLPWHKTRRLELDWLRVLAFGILILYHVGMLYAHGWDWHFKSNYTSEFLTNIMLWSNQWRMSLLFLISGVAVSYLLQGMSLWRFYTSRHTKILLPLLFGMAVVVVPQVYVEMASKGLIENIGFSEFWLAYLDQSNHLFAEMKTVGSAHLTWNHLWFLMYIFSYSLILWALYPVLTSAALLPFWRQLNQHTPKLLIIIGPIVCFYLIGSLLWERYPTTNAFIGDWFNHAKSFSCFLIGFALVRSTRLWSALSGFRWTALIGAIVGYAYIVFAHNGGQMGEGVFWQELNGLLWAANAWLWIVTVIAWAQHKLTFSTPTLKYLNGGVYCFYILHQTVIIMLAYYFVPMQTGPVLEPILIITGTTLICWGSYEILANIPLLSSLFGIKGSKSGFVDQLISKIKTLRGSLYMA